TRRYRARRRLAAPGRRWVVPGRRRVAPGRRWVAPDGGRVVADYAAAVPPGEVAPGQADRGAVANRRRGCRRRRSGRGSAADLVGLPAVQHTLTGDADVQAHSDTLPALTAASPG